MSAKDAEDAGDAGDVVHGEMLKKPLNKSANPSALIRVGPAWRSAKVRRWVGGTGRPALYLKVGPAGLGLRPYHGPRGQGPPVAGFKGSPPLGGQPRYFLFCQRLLAGLLACLLARLLACLLVFSAFPGRTRLPTASTNQRSAI